MMFTVVQRMTTGTEKGVNYLQKEIPWLPYSFMGSLAKISVYTTIIIVPLSYGRKRLQAILDNSASITIKSKMCAYQGVVQGVSPRIRIPSTLEFWHSRCLPPLEQKYDCTKYMTL